MIKYIIVYILIIVVAFLLCTFLFIPFADAHENDEFHHAPTGHCFGWKIIDGTKRICFVDEEQTTCKEIIYAHDLWHVSEEYECEEKYDREN